MSVVKGEIAITLNKEHYDINEKDELVVRFPALVHAIKHLREYGEGQFRLEIRCGDLNSWANLRFS